MTALPSSRPLEAAPRPEGRPTGWCDLPSAEAIVRWQRQLRIRVGMEPRECARMLLALDDFCERHAVTPARLVSVWRDYPALTVRRRPGAGPSPEPAVESFLIHNGVNIFGDIVCVAGRPEDLEAQGPQFQRRPAP